MSKPKVTPRYIIQATNLNNPTDAWATDTPSSKDRAIDTAIIILIARTGIDRNNQYDAEERLDRTGTATLRTPQGHWQVTLIPQEQPS